jgi:hypothetical protein
LLRLWATRAGIVGWNGCIDFPCRGGRRRSSWLSDRVHDAAQEYRRGFVPVGLRLLGPAQNLEAAMALATGTIVVACNNRVHSEALRGLLAVDPTSGQQRTLAQGGMFAEPVDVVFLPDGRLLVADNAAFGGGGGLIAVDPDTGQQTKVASSSEFHQPSGLAVRNDGHVLVAYSLRPGGFGSVLRVNPANGDHFGVAPTFEFLTPTAVAVGTADNVTVIDVLGGLGTSRLIRVETGVGARIRHEGAGFWAGIALEPSGNLVVTSDAPGGNQKLLRFHPVDGPPTVVSIGLFGGVAVEASGAILVCMGSRGVFRVDPVNGAQTLVSSLRGGMGLAVRR